VGARFFTFSLAGGEIRPLPPVSYATAHIQAHTN